MGSWLRSLLVRTSVVLVGVMLVVALLAPSPANAQPAVLPPVALDIVDGHVWSISELWMAPGQELVITNRDVDRHTFTVDAWGIDENLPSLTPVTVVIPANAVVGTSVEFYSAVLDDRELGLEGTINIVTPQDVLDGIQLIPNLGQEQTDARVRIHTRDDFSFEPALVTVNPGTIIEVVNVGVIEHHFAVQDWGINQTIPPGKMVLVRVPDDAVLGATVPFNCTMPGHAQQGMEGVMRITGNANEVTTVVRTTAGESVVPIDMRPFIPEASTFGSGWQRLRSGSSESILGSDVVHDTVFPYSGMGAVYVGPNGARVTVVALPLQTVDIPLSQVKNAVGSVQSILSQSWTVDPVAGMAWRSIEPPNGCTVSERVSGIVPTVTIPSGVTSCQLTGVGIALFVAVEGEFDGYQGVYASDRIVSRIVGGDIVEARNDR